MSTELEPRPNSNFEAIIKAFVNRPHLQSDAATEALAEAQNLLQELKDKRLEERFYYITAIILLLDILLLPSVPPLLIAFVCIVEAAVLLALAEKFGVEQVGRWVDKCMGLFVHWCESQKNRPKS